MSKELYKQVRLRKVSLPSWLSLLLSENHEEPTVSTVDRALKSQFGDSLIEMTPGEAKTGSWSANISIDWQGQKINYRAWIDYGEDLHEAHYSMNGFSEGEIEAIGKSQRQLNIETTYSTDVLSDYHRHLKVAAAMGCSFIAILDHAACSLKSASWVLQTAKTNALPDPQSLFSIHCVYDEESNQAWMHTHGLMRCYSLEWEILGIQKENSHALSDIITNMACNTILHPYANADEAFEIVQGIPLVWLPYEKALNKLDVDLGGWQDRDKFHSMPSGVLLLKSKKLFIFRRYYSLDVIADIMNDNPVVNIPQQETQRMTELAKEKFPLFRDYFSLLKGHEDFVFLIKIGYQIDGSENSDEREHLWFETQVIQDQKIKATLLNQPYNIERMNEGDVDWHKLELITDWQIMSKYGTFPPSQLSSLEFELKKIGLLNKTTESV